jgi:hypothetical protein
MTKLQRKHPGVAKLRSVVACERMSKTIARPMLDVGDLVSFFREDRRAGAKPPFYPLNYVDA